VNNYIAQISLLVNDYDEAIAFYTQKLGFVLLEDTKLSDTKRWVLVAPAADSQFRLLLAKAVDNQISAVGNQSGGRVFLFLFTDNFEEMYQLLLEQKVTIVRNPEE
jgi:catechol 2,3-dioxygenase-like lactoylglutathione lyase family enzyme